MTTDQISVVPANKVSWDDLKTVFGTRGDAASCQCQWFKFTSADGARCSPMNAPSSCASRPGVAIRGPVRRPGWSSSSTSRPVGALSSLAPPTCA